MTRSTLDQAPRAVPLRQQPCVHKASHQPGSRHLQRLLPKLQLRREPPLLEISKDFLRRTRTFPIAVLACSRGNQTKSIVGVSILDISSHPLPPIRPLDLQLRDVTQWERPRRRSPRTSPRWVPPPISSRSPPPSFGGQIRLFFGYGPVEAKSFVMPS